ncbi:Proteasome assembly chaperone 3 [Gracilaria domingensis]|nr:Proteasome assembly chaperone 3 [Gracilaria domingensis]
MRNRHFPHFEHCLAREDGHRSHSNRYIRRWLTYLAFRPFACPSTFALYAHLCAGLRACSKQAFSAGASQIRKRTPYRLRNASDPTAIMVGTLDPTARHNAIPISAPTDDSGHNAHFIKSATVQICDRRTDFLVQPFSDRIFVLVTQMEKMGTTLSASKEVTIAGAESFSVQTLIGIRDIPELELCARTIIAKISENGCAKPLLVSLALRDHSMRTIRAVIEKVTELRVW